MAFRCKSPEVSFAHPVQQNFQRPNQRKGRTGSAGQKIRRRWILGRRNKYGTRRQRPATNGKPSATRSAVDRRRNRQGRREIVDQSLFTRLIGVPNRGHRLIRVLHLYWNTCKAIKFQLESVFRLRDCSPQTRPLPAAGFFWRHVWKVQMGDEVQFLKELAPDLTHLHLAQRWPSLKRLGKPSAATPGV